MVAYTSQPPGEPPDARTLSVNENLDDNNNDSDFMQDSSDENYDSTKDDFSLHDENDIDLKHEALEQSA